MCMNNTLLYLHILPAEQDPSVSMNRISKIPVSPKLTMGSLYDMHSSVESTSARSWYNNSVASRLDTHTSVEQLNPEIPCLSA